MLGKVLTKTVGIAAAGIGIYDIWTATKRQSTRAMQNYHIDRLNDVYLRTDSGYTSSTSANKMQKWARNWYLSDNWLLRSWDGIKSYTSNIIRNTSNNLTTLGLSAVAIFAKGKLAFTGKIAAALLGLKLGKFILHDLFGVGAVDPRYKNY